MTSFTRGQLLGWSFASLDTIFGGITINGEQMVNNYSLCAIFTCGKECYCYIISRV